MSQLVDPNSISCNYNYFRKNYNFYYLFKTIALLFKQNRFTELIVGLFNSIIYKPQKIFPISNATLFKILRESKSFFYSKNFYNQGDLVTRFNNKYSFNLLPKDFTGTRCGSFIELNDKLIIGEYGELKKRIFILSKSTCEINSYYDSDPKVRHIHAVCKYLNNAKSILVSTGDTAKYLDLWEINVDGLWLKNRLKSKFGGYTAMTNVISDCLFGTDFSNRPNYIEDLNGKKYFFPSLSFKKYTVKFWNYNNNFILSINTELSWFGNDHTVTIFDVSNRKFVYCNSLENTRQLICM